MPPLRRLIINAPATFRVLWAMVRHLLDARTQAKIEVRAWGRGRCLECSFP